MGLVILYGISTKFNKMTLKKIKNIVIVGGGTSGWLTAAYFNNNFPDFSITVIDKIQGTPVGVGEGTLLNFDKFMLSCGFNKEEWIKEIDATYKSGIYFPNWQSKNNNIWHPFFHSKVLENDVNSIDMWSNNQNLNFKKYAIGHYDISIEKNEIDMDNLNHYSYHVDCIKLIKFIQNKILKKITLIKSDVTKIFRDKNNNIEKLLLLNNKKVTGDIFIDCTGFKSLLKNCKKNNLKNRLICNTAIAAHIPYINREEELKPYVISDAVECGWVWHIPVKNRIGSGIVFNKDITSIENAKIVFLKYWNNRISEKDLRVIDWTPYYVDDIWQNNVVSIGLSAGFIEPLESTGLALIMEGIYSLGKKISKCYYTNDDIKLYNLTLKYFFDDSIDFVSMHYYNSKRTEKFWKIVNDQLHMSEKHKFYLDYMRDKKLLIKNLRPRHHQDTHIFSGLNWILWLIQLNNKIVPKNIKNNVNDLILNYESFKKNKKIKHYFLIDNL